MERKIKYLLQRQGKSAPSTKLFQAMSNPKGHKTTNRDWVAH